MLFVKLFWHGRFDPTTERQARKAFNIAKSRDDFESLVADWHDLQNAKWSKLYLERVRTLLNGNVLTALGKIPVTKLSAPMILERIRAIESRGALEQAARGKKEDSECLAELGLDFARVLLDIAAREIDELQRGDGSIARAD